LPDGLGDNGQTSNLANTTTSFAQEGVMVGVTLVASGSQANVPEMQIQPVTNTVYKARNVDYISFLWGSALHEHEIYKMAAAQLWFQDRSYAQLIIMADQDHCSSSNSSGHGMLVLQLGLWPATDQFTPLLHINSIFNFPQFDTLVNMRLEPVLRLLDTHFADRPDIERDRLRHQAIEILQRIHHAHSTRLCQLASIATEALCENRRIPGLVCSALINVGSEAGITASNSSQAVGQDVPGEPANMASNHQLIGLSIKGSGTLRQTIQQQHTYSRPMVQINRPTSTTVP
jgi:hypothetical protein